jgi:hypothetical protein
MTFIIYTLRQIKITLIKTRRMKWEIPVTCMEEVGTAYDTSANKAEGKRLSGRYVYALMGTLY